MKIDLVRRALLAVCAIAAVGLGVRELKPVLRTPAVVAAIHGAHRGGAWLRTVALHREGALPAAGSVPASAPHVASAVNVASRVSVASAASAATAANAASAVNAASAASAVNVANAVSVASAANAANAVNVATAASSLLPDKSAKPAKPALTPRDKLIALRAPLSLESTNNPFVASSWLPPPPPPVEAPPAAPEPVAPPTAPPLPFVYLGELDAKAAKPQVFLSSGDRLLIVAPGEVVDGQYRIESISDSDVVLTYLPLNEKQVLSTQAKENK